MSEISVEDILLDPQNPRHNPIEYQRDILAFFAQEKETLELAKDIAEHGVNPGIRPICTPHEGKYVALDGNRRIAAIKLLRDPDLCQDSNISNKFSELDIKKIPDVLPCAVVDSREEGRHWLELLHGGKQDGAGQVPWSPIQKQRFYGDKGRYPHAMNVLNYLADSFGINIENVPLSTLDRIIQDQYVREKLGIEFSEGKTETKKDGAAVGAVLNRIVGDLISKDIKEPDVTDKKHRKDYLDRVLKEEKIELTDSSQKTELGSQNKKPPEKPKKLAPSPLNRTYLIPSNFRVSARHHRVNALFRELKEVNVKRFPNACAGLFRTLVAIACLVYKEQIMGERVTRKDSPSSALRAALAHMEQNGVITDLHAKPVRTYLDNADSPYSLDTMNSSLHNPNQTPNSDGLRKAWDDLTPFLKELLNNV